MATKGLNIAQVITMYLTRGTPAPNFEADLPTYKPSPRLVWLCIRQSLCFFHTFSTEDALLISLLKMDNHYGNTMTSSLRRKGRAAAS